MAAVAAHPADSFCGAHGMVAVGDGRRDSIDALLRSQRGGTVPAGSLLAATASGYYRSAFLWVESRTALHADHSNDRAAVSGRDDLERSVAGGIYACFTRRSA